VAEVDPELRRLLVMELTRHLATLEGDDAPGARRALHAMKGSAGLAGERDLAEAFQRVERRVRDGDSFALADAVHVARTAVARLSHGSTAVIPVWPEPPDDMVPVPVDPSAQGQYVSEVLDHLTALDRALGMTDDPAEAVATVFRHVHTIKGAASSVKDEPMTWFCHGLEERLRLREPSREVAKAALAETLRWRGTLSALLTDPDGALRTLRSPGSRQRASEFPSKRPSTRPPISDAGRVDDEPARLG
jgi:two-component system chemotaxis sensor kinase CheA